MKLECFLLSLLALIVVLVLVTAGLSTQQERAQVITNKANFNYTHSVPQCVKCH